MSARNGALSAPPTPDEFVARWRAERRRGGRMRRRFRGWLARLGSGWSGRLPLAWWDRRDG